MAFWSDAAERPVDTRAAPFQGNQGDTDEAFAHPESVASYVLVYEALSIQFDDLHSIDHQGRRSHRLYRQAGQR